MERSSERRVRLPKALNLSNRAGTRFPIALELRYAVKGRQPITGFGRTIELSSGALTFAADEPLESGDKLEVTIDWPALLDGGVRLQLVMTGKIVRTYQTETEVTIQRHEFRTRGEGLKVAAANR